LNLRSIDLNLLVVFDAIIRERSVTTAANRLAMTPSAVSHALGRLRVMLNDELIKRTPRGFEPTPRALQLALLLGEGLKRLEWAIEDQTDFDPLLSTREFALNVSDYVGVFLQPALCERLRRDAPNVRLTTERLSVNHDRTDPGEVQLRVGWMPRPYEYRRKRVFEDEFCVVMRPDHEAAQRPLSLETYIRLSHLKVSSTAIGTSMIDEALAKRGLTRNIVVTVANWFEVAPIVERTDLIATVPRHCAAIDQRMSHFVCHPIPLNDITFTVDQCWHPSYDRDPGHRWFRSLLAETLLEVQQTSVA
jgi:DNA-binding transcriptional LysR family regulator